MINQQNIISLIETLAAESPVIEVVWLYGSRAKGNANEKSDYDLAIAYSQINDKSASSGYYSDDLTYKWSQKTSRLFSRVSVSFFRPAFEATAISLKKSVRL